MLKTTLTALLLAALPLAGAAQDLRTDLTEAEPPAEFPPQSYTARQYVDSRGCVYVRAGEIGERSWVPRVTADRRVLCGFTPTRITRDLLPVIADPVADAAPAPEAPQTRRTIASQPRSVATRPRQAGQGAAIPAARVTSPAVLDPGQRLGIVPAPEVRVPPGYRPAWTDGRLNPNRGKQTLNGALQTSLYWTQTVPRQLRSGAGQDVTRTYHYLVYPYTDYHRQLSDLESGRYVQIRTPRGPQIVPRR